MESLAARIILLWGWRRAAVAFAAGAFASLAQAPFDFFAACFVAFPVLVWLLDGAAGDTAWRRFAASFASGWWFGFGYFVASLWWIGAAVLVEAEAFAWALPFAVFGLPAILALFHGLAAALARLAWSEGIGRIFALAVGFGIAEWLRATVLSGFPWNAIGYAAMPVPELMQSVRIAGLFGMNVLAVFVFAMPALLASTRHRRTGLALAVLLVAAHAGYGFARLSAAPEAASSLDVRIVQPSVNQSRKWDNAERTRIFRTYLDLSSAPAAAGEARAGLVMWPETAVPFFLTDEPEALAEMGEAIQEEQTLLTGAVRREGAGAGDTRYYNSVVAVGPDGEIVDAVDKVHLVPFGEYVPFGALLRRLGVEEIVETLGPFSPGGPRRTIEVAEGVRALPLICYEIIFPGLVLADADGADMIVNVTNDAWYGDTPGPYQHFRQAQVRAVEAGLPLVRSANSGISAVVDAHGRIVDALAVGAYGTLDAAVPLDGGKTLAFGSPPFNGAVILAAFGVAAIVIGAGSRLRPN